MRKVIDLYLDLPTGDDLYLNRLSQYCLGNGKEARDGYRRFFGGAEAKAIGFTLDELDKIVAEKGEEEFKRVVTAQASKYNITMDQFMGQLDELGVEWGFTGAHDRNNQRTAELVSKYPTRLKGAAYIEEISSTYESRSYISLFSSLVASVVYIYCK